MQTAADGGLVVRSVRVPYRGPNRAPVVSGVSVSALTADLQGGGGSSSYRQSLAAGVAVEYSFSENGGEREPSRIGVWARTLRSASWEAADADRDPLRFALYLRPLEEERFVLLEEKLEEAAFGWDGAAWPDGWYEVKDEPNQEQARDNNAHCSGINASSALLTAAPKAPLELSTCSRAGHSLSIKRTAPSAARTASFFATFLISETASRRRWHASLDAFQP